MVKWDVLLPAIAWFLKTALIIGKADFHVTPELRNSVVGSGEWWYMSDPYQGLGVLGADIIVLVTAAVQWFTQVDRITSVPSSASWAWLEEYVRFFISFFLPLKKNALLIQVKLDILILATTKSSTLAVYEAVRDNKNCFKNSPLVYKWSIFDFMFCS